MPCRPFVVGGKLVGFVCGRAERAKPCHYCGSRSNPRLCDFKLWGPKAGKTCDLPMCARCSFRPQGSEEDYCRAHAAILREGEGSAAEP